MLYYFRILEEAALSVNDIGTPHFITSLQNFVNRSGKRIAYHINKLCLCWISMLTGRFFSSWTALNLLSKVIYDAFFTQCL